jgi:hypothetical protein
VHPFDYAVDSTFTGIHIQTPPRTDLTDMSSIFFEICEHIIGYGGRDLSIETDLPADDVVQILRRHTETPTNPTDHLPPMLLKTPLGLKTINRRPAVRDPDKPFAGTVSRDRIVLRLRTKPPQSDSDGFITGNWNSFTPHLRGSIEPSDDGAIIRGTLTTHRLVVSGIALFGGISAGFLGYVAWLQMTTPDTNLSIGFLLFPLALLAFAFIIGRVGIYYGRRDIPRLEEHLSELV